MEYNADRLPCAPPVDDQKRVTIKFPTDAALLAKTLGWMYNSEDFMTMMMSDELVAKGIAAGVDITTHDDTWQEIGTVGVDSGELIIIDPCYLKLNKRGLAISGWGGDGNFKVYERKNDAGLVLEVKVVFNEE